MCGLRYFFCKRGRTCPRGLTTKFFLFFGWFVPWGRGKLENLSAGGGKFFVAISRLSRVCPVWAVLAEGPCIWDLARALPRAILSIIPRALARAIYGPHRAILTDIPSAFPCTFPRATLRVPSLGPPLGPSPIGPLNRALPRTSPPIPRHTPGAPSLGPPLGFGAIPMGHSSALIGAVPRATPRAPLGPPLGPAHPQGHHWGLP